MDAIVAYACGSCGLSYAERENAQRCCATKPIAGFACLNCGDLYTSKDEADACCVEDEPVDEPGQAPKVGE